jgi:hypothetical protein
MRNVVFVLIAAALVSCTSIVKKPEVNAVKKIAIATLYAPQEVLYKHGNSKADKWDKETRERIGKVTYEAFTQEFKKTLGWTILPYQTVLSNKVYQAKFVPQEAPKDSSLLGKGLALAGKLVARQSALSTFSIPGMTPIPWYQDGDQQETTFDLMQMKTVKNDTWPNKAEELAQSLGADGVIFLFMDYCYGDGVSVAGNGEAYILGQAMLSLYDKNGVEVVKLPNIENRCQTAPYGGKSTHSAAIVGGSFLLADKFNKDSTVTMFQEAAVATASSVAKEIDAAIKKN